MPSFEKKAMIFQVGVCNLKIFIYYKTLIVEMQSNSDQESKASKAWNKQDM